MGVYLIVGAAMIFVAMAIGSTVLLLIGAALLFVSPLLSD